MCGCYGRDCGLFWCDGCVVGVWRVVNGVLRVVSRCGERDEWDVLSVNGDDWDVWCGGRGCVMF